MQICNAGRMMDPNHRFSALFSGVGQAMRAHGQLDEERDFTDHVADVIIQYPRNECFCGRPLTLRPGGNGRFGGRHILVATDDGMQCGIEIVKHCSHCRRMYFHNYYDDIVENGQANNDMEENQENDG